MYAHREEMPQHQAGLAALQALVADEEPWALLWPCLYEFIRVITHPRVMRPPTPLKLALKTTEDLIGNAAVVLPVESPRHGTWMRRMLHNGSCIGNLVHDAHIAALMREHSIDAIVTADKDFHRFPGIRVIDPLQ